MIPINPHTRIAFLIKNHPDALEKIISISPRFNKLRNPVLRKLLAGRASISMAAGVAGCTVQEFMDHLKPLGFHSTSMQPVAEEKKRPQMLVGIQPGLIIEFDVREILQKDHDPLPHILKMLRSLREEQVLKIINSFEPLPLMTLLGKQGYGSYSEMIDTQLFHTYFFREGKDPVIPETRIENRSADWEKLLRQFLGKLEIIDVRQLEMPGPMMAILEALDKLPGGKALFVHHKRIPLFLLPELAERKFSYRLKEISENEVHLLIFRE